MSSAEPETVKAEPSVAQKEAVTEASGWYADITTHGVFRWRVFISAITPGSVVMVSITELSSSGAPFIGDAVMRIDNVSPGGGYVDVRGEINWSSNLRARLNILVQ
ncbi:hypothetical protein ACT1U9_17345 [Streptomyces sp. BR1]|uniref:hypothetical protein n=1 Tax=Streptomyces sp. BR1 TaxID=1592323 RepID=UPI00402B277F